MEGFVAVDGGRGLRFRLLAIVLASTASPALAQGSDPLAPLPTSQQPIVLPPPSPPVAAPAQSTGIAPQAPAPVQAVVPKTWRGVFDAIRSGNWASARAGIAALPASPLGPVALAELYTAKGSPVVDLASIQSLLAQAPDLPQAAQLARMAYTRGATQTPPIYPARQTVNLGSAPVRYRARPVSGEPLADELRAALDPLVKNNDAAGAEAQLLTYAPQLSFEARAEAAQRVAWTYYALGQDADAKRVADTWRPGATGEWAGHAAWVAGLAAWRMGDCNGASQAFQQVASLAPQRELRAGALYWTARSEQACRRPRSVAPLLRAAASAAASNESFYGLLARETLGMDTKLPADPHLQRDPSIDHLPNVQRARELVKIGEMSLAEEFLRHQAKIGQPGEHHALIQLAKALDLPAAQLWLANNGQPGAVADAADRYPNPRWAPANGWRIDPALAFGHIVQDSSFRRAAVSPAGAVGLMQVRPGTAGDVARKRGTPLGSLTDPATNLEYGQSFIEMMRGNSGTAGQLPRVIASYNAGPLPVARWAAINDKGDPLLWIESLPYWETRYYVPSVLRNMWVYQGLNHQPTPTLKAMAEHHWPAFPTGQTQLKH
jgi:soluble lytic murein transglycosylase-like protein